jgi:hypothetical protein
MQSSMLFVWAGALLIVVGVVYTAWQTLRRGRLSDARSVRPGSGSDTLEPQGRSMGFSLKANWPGLALIAVGAVLLLASGAI